MLTTGRANEPVNTFVHNLAYAKMIGQGGNHAQSEDSAKTHGKGLFSFEELPQLINSGLLKDLRLTYHYQKNGLVWFYLADVGIEKNEYHRINYNASTAEEMFKPVSESQYFDLLFYERAYFGRGNGPVSVEFYSGDASRRLGIVANRSPMLIAPIVIGAPKETALEQMKRE